MDLMSVPAWLQGILQALIGGLIGAYIGPWFHTRFQDRSRARREHLDDLRAHVLRPLRGELEDFYMLLLQGKVGPVISEHMLMPAERSVTESGTTWTWRLAQRRRVDQPSFPWTPSPEPQPAVSPQLYEDTERRHYPKFIRRLEAFKAEVDRYTAAWKSYAEDLSRTIAERAGLPVVRWDTANTDPSWVDPDGLTIFVLERQLGVNPHPIWPGSDRRSLGISGRAFVKAETEAAIPPIYALLDELAQDRRRMEELQQPAEALRQEAAALLRELEHLIHSAKLRGRCPLCKV